MQRFSFRVLLAAVGLCLAAGALGGVAAADHAGDSKVNSNVSVAVDDDGGYFSVLCTGSPTDHDCDKSGRLDAGPAAVDYRGFNNDSLENCSSRFGDTFVFTIDGEEYTVAFTCEFTDEPPEESPCRPGGDGEDPEGDDDSDDESNDDDDDGSDESNDEDDNSDDEGDEDDDGSDDDSDDDGENRKNRENGR